MWDKKSVVEKETNSDTNWKHDAVVGKVEMR